VVISWLVLRLQSYDLGIGVCNLCELKKMGGFVKKGVVAILSDE
jgi:hypothetical protein